VGLWSCPSVAHVPLEIFLDIAKKHVQKYLQIIIDEDTGEVEDLFQRPYNVADVTMISSDPSPNPEITQKQTEGSDTGAERSLSLDLDTFGSQQVFGLQRLKKRKMQSSISCESETKLQETPVTSGFTFDPLEHHRFFCPYRMHWKEILGSVVSLQNLK